MQRHDHSPETWLDEADRKRLAAALAGAREARVYRRLEALLLVAEGHSMAEAARRCRVDRSSVHRWLAQYRAEHQTTALIDRPRSGRPRLHHTLTPRRLAAALARDPRRCGYQATSWTVPLLAQRDIVIGGTRAVQNGLTAHVVYDGPLHPPIAEGAVVAHLVVEGPGYETQQFPLVAGRRVGKANWFSRAFEGLRLTLFSPS